MTIRQIRMQSPLLLAKQVIYSLLQRPKTGFEPHQTRWAWTGTLHDCKPRASRAGCDPYCLGTAKRTCARRPSKLVLRQTPGTEEAFEFFRHPAAGGSTAQRGEVLTWTSSARRFLSSERGLLQQGNTFSVQGKSSAQTGGRGAVSQSAAGRLVGPGLCCDTSFKTSDWEKVKTDWCFFCGQRLIVRKVTQN